MKMFEEKDPKIKLEPTMNDKGISTDL